MNLDAEATALQAALLNQGIAEIEARASDSLLLSLRTNPQLRDAVESGIHMGVIVSFKHFARVDETAKFKSVIRDLYEALAVNGSRRVIGTKVIQRILDKYRP
jgi:hypothetical protein